MPSGLRSSGGRRLYGFSFMRPSVCSPLPFSTKRLPAPFLRRVPALARSPATSGHFRAVDKPPYIGNISDYHGKLCIKLPISVAKKKVMVCYAMAFIIRFRFNAVDDKRHCCSAASNPLLYRNFKLCLAFCVAKLPSLHICRRSKTFACLSVPSFS